jgi:hypothetical protein
LSGTGTGKERNSRRQRSGVAMERRREGEEVLCWEMEKKN